MNYESLQKLKSTELPPTASGLAQAVELAWPRVAAVSVTEVFEVEGSKSHVRVVGIGKGLTPAIDVAVRELIDNTRTMGVLVDVELLEQSIPGD